MQIILASKSPWRRRLMKKHGIECKIHASGFKEKKKHSSPRMLAIHNACGKACVAVKHHADAFVIGVDTIVVLGGRIIGKPRGREHARRMLLSLSGTTHKVISGLCVINSRTGKKRAAAVETKVTFRKIGAEELEKYLNSGQWQGKAGSYAIQARAKGFVEKIQGDKTNVVGLPMKTLKKILGI